MSDTPPRRTSDALRSSLPAIGYLLLWLLLTWGSYASYYPGLLQQDLRFTPAVLRATEEILAGLFGHYGAMLVFNAMLLWLGLILTVSSIVRHWALAAALILLLGLTPYYFPYVAYHFKDIPFGASLLLACGLLMKARDSGRTSLIYVAMGAVFFATCMRYDGFPAILPLCFSIVCLLKRNIPAITQRTAPGGIALFAIMLGLAILTTSFASRRYEEWYPLGAYPVQVPLLYDVVGTSVHSNEVFVPDLYTSETPQAQDLGHLKKIYSETTSRSVLYESSRGQYLGMLHTAADLHELVRAWVTAVSRQPFAYLQHRTRFFKNFLYPGGSVLHENYILHVEHLYASQRIGKAAYEYLAWHFVSRNAVWWKPLVLLLAYIGMTCWLLRRRFQDDPVIIGMMFSGFLYLLSHWFLGTAAHVKYSWWGFISAPIVLLYVLRHARPPLTRWFGFGKPS